MSNYHDIIISSITRTPFLVLSAASASVIFVLSVDLSGTQILDIVGYQALCKDSVSKTGNYVSIPSIVASKLAELIAAERLIAKIDKANFAIADAATHDAMIMVRRVKLGGTPHILLSDDGILALQWQRGEYGVALLFAGDGVASISFRRPGKFYAENGIDVSIYDDLPADFNDAIAAILV
jgi:hypothetical protein